MKPKEVSQLMSELFSGKFTKEYTEEDLNRVLSQQNVFPFLYYRDGNLIAITMLYVVELFSRKFGVIEEVVTLMTHRNKGVGSGLVKKAIEKARDLGCDCVELNVREDKPEVQRFYEALGFLDRKNKSMRLQLKKN